MMPEDLTMLKVEWQRRLIGMKYVQSEDELFEDLQVLQFCLSPAPNRYDLGGKLNLRL